MLVEYYKEKAQENSERITQLPDSTVKDELEYLHTKMMAAIEHGNALAAMRVNAELQRAIKEANGITNYMLKHELICIIQEITNTKI